MAKKVNIDTLKYFNELIAMNIKTLDSYQRNDVAFESQIKVRSFIIEYCYKLMKHANGEPIDGKL